MDYHQPKQRLFTPPFVITIILLGSAALIAGPVADWLHITDDKLSLVLRKPLGQLDGEQLSPYRLIERHVLEKSLVEALGTDQYLMWELEDTELDAGDPLKRASLLITYDTGGRYLVPHRPDVCYLGAGYSPAQAHENIEVDIKRSAADFFSLPIRVCTFMKTALHDHEKVSVIYTFHANGQYIADAMRVRFLINAPTARHAYFSKVEVSFPRATREQSIQGARKLYAVILPILIEHHWPDFLAAEQSPSRN